MRCKLSGIQVRYVTINGCDHGTCLNCPYVGKIQRQFLVDFGKRLLKSSDKDIQDFKNSIGGKKQ